MSLRQLPQINMSTFAPRADMGALQFDAPAEALERWSAVLDAPRAEAAPDGVETITIMDVIGYDSFEEGVTSKRIAAALRLIGSNPVRVEINSPGGDFFEGLAIYNQLAAHPAKVTVRVLGLAASAASVIAMAGDEIEMGAGSFMMIHKAWGGLIGNAEDMLHAADAFLAFDQSMAGLYAARTGLSEKAVMEMMAAETWLSAQDAVAKGFADRVVNMPAGSQDPKPADARRKAQARADALLARQGLPRSERRKLMRDLTGGMPGAALAAMPGAGAVADGAAIESQDVNAAFAALLNTLKA